MLVTALPQVMRSHLQFGAVLDNAVIRLEMQKSSLKLNNIFVTVLRGADCLEPCWSLDLEYFGVVLAVESVKITSEHPVGGFVVGAFGSRLQALAFPWSHRLALARFCCPRRTGLSSGHLDVVQGDGSGPAVCRLGDVGATGGCSQEKRSLPGVPCLHARRGSAPLSSHIF